MITRACDVYRRATTALPRRPSLAPSSSLTFSPRTRKTRTPDTRWRTRTRPREAASRDSHVHEVEDEDAPTWNGDCSAWQSCSRADTRCCWRYKQFACTYNENTSLAHMFAREGKFCTNRLPSIDVVTRFVIRDITISTRTNISHLLCFFCRSLCMFFLHLLALSPV